MKLIFISSNMWCVTVACFSGVAVSSCSHLSDRLTKCCKISKNRSRRIWISGKTQLAVVSQHVRKDVHF